MADISTLPVWKKDSTPSEWLQELAAMALEHPERWARAVVIYEEVNQDGHPHKTRQHAFRIANNNQILGTIESAKLELWEFMKGRS